MTIPTPPTRRSRRIAPATQRPSAWRRVLPWAWTLVLLGGAWALNAATLPDDATQTGITSPGQVGEAAQTRNLVATVTDVRAAREVSDTSGWSAEGTWLIVEVTAEAVDTQFGSLLGLAELRIGERTFRATERGNTFMRAPLIPGIPQSGSLAFELPPDALAGTAVLMLGPTAEPQLDGVIEIPLALDQVPVEATVTLTETGWAR